MLFGEPPDYAVFTTKKRDSARAQALHLLGEGDLAAIVSTLLAGGMTVPEIDQVRPILAGFHSRVIDIVGDLVMRWDLHQTSPSR